MGRRRAVAVALVVAGIVGAIALSSRASVSAIQEASPNARDAFGARIASAGVSYVSVGRARGYIGFTVLAFGEEADAVAAYWAVTSPQTPTIGTPVPSAASQFPGLWCRERGVLRGLCAL